MHKFLQRHKLKTQDETEHVNRSIVSRQTTSHKEKQTQIASMVKSNQAYKNQYQSFRNSCKKIKEKTLTNLFYETSITLIPNLVKDITTKLHIQK